MLEPIRLKEEDRTILLNSTRITILLSRLMDLYHIVLVTILRRTRPAHTTNTPVRHQDTVHTRTMDTLVTFRNKVRDPTLRTIPITKVVRLSQPRFSVQ
jgi:hypothetical protein